MTRGWARFGTRSRPTGRTVPRPTAKRSPALPNVPTASEAGVPPYVTTNWFGWAVPKGTPKEFINALRDDVVKAVNSPDVRERLAAQGAEPSNFTPEEFARFLREDTQRWAAVIKKNNIKVE